MIGVTAPASAGRGGEPERIEDTVRRLKQSNPALAKILSEQLEPEAEIKTTGASR